MIVGCNSHVFLYTFLEAVHCRQLSVFPSFWLIIQLQCCDSYYYSASIIVLNDIIPVLAFRTNAMRKWATTQTIIVTVFSLNYDKVAITELAKTVVFDVSEKSRYLALQNNYYCGWLLSVFVVCLYNTQFPMCSKLNCFEWTQRVMINGLW